MHTLLKPNQRALHATAINALVLPGNAAVVAYVVYGLWQRWRTAA